MLGTVLALMLVFVTGCLSAEQSAALEKNVSRAVKYYKEKYNIKSVELSDSGYLGYDGLFGMDETEDMYYFVGSQVAVEKEDE